MHILFLYVYFTGISGKTACLVTSDRQHGPGPQVLKVTCPTSIKVNEAPQTPQGSDAC